ncbi:MAG: NUDIX domain-containing protein [Phycisphaerae bacterium]
MSQIVANIVDVYVFRRSSGGAELLLLERAAGRPLSGTWQSVHGKIEAGETAWQAALRELREETGLSPRGFWQIDYVNAFYVAADDVVSMCPCFAAEVAPAAGVILSDEHTAHRWLPIETALQELMWPGQRHALREIRDEIIQPGRAEPHLRIG